MSQLIVEILEKSAMNLVTELFNAVDEDDLEKIQSLLKKGLTINIKDTENVTALHKASRNGSRSTVAFLLRNGALLNAQNNDKRTPLHIAANAGNLPGVEILLSAGAAVNIKNSKGNTPLHEAAYKGHEETVKLLLKKGAKVNAKNKKCITPLYYAAQRNYLPVIKRLLRHGAYSYNDESVDKELDVDWEASIIDHLGGRSFYITLLVAGVSTEGQILPYPLSIIQNNIESTVANWLKPLTLSQDECRDITSKVLRAFPQLIHWLKVIDQVDRKTKQTEDRDIPYKNHGLSFFASAEKDTNNQVLFILLRDKLPQELIDLIQERFTQRTLIDPIATFLMDTYTLPWNVVHYLATEGLAHPKKYIDFLSHLFEHNWQTPYPSPTDDPNSVTEATRALQGLHS